MSLKQWLDADELIEFVVEMEKDVRKWLQEHHPDLL